MAGRINIRSKDASRCWCKVMGEFIMRGDTDEYPFTWEGMYQLLEDIKCGGIAQISQGSSDSFH